MLAGMKKWMRFAATCTAALLLTACGRSVVVQPNRGAAPSRASTAVTRSTPGSYRVVRGDTLYSIAFRHGVDFRDLAAWNGIASPCTIWPGQVLRLSPGQGRTAGPRRPVASASAPSRAPVFKPVTPAPSHPAAAPAAVVTAPAAATPPPPAVPAPQGTTRVAGGVNWRWPADGALI